MKEVLENLSVALGYKGEINETVVNMAANMLASGMDHAEMNAYAEKIDKTVAKEIRKIFGNY
jgi:roadblock/LC7 domain-containing protein